MTLPPSPQGWSQETQVLLSAPTLSRWVRWRVDTTMSRPPFLQLYSQGSEWTSHRRLLHGGSHTPKRDPTHATFQNRPDNGVDIRAASVAAVQRGWCGPRRGTGDFMGSWKCSISVKGEAGAVFTHVRTLPTVCLKGKFYCKLNLHLKHF